MTTTPPVWASFELERWQSDWEQKVEIDIADSDVDPVTLGELLRDAATDLHAHQLHSPEVNGTRQLRERIAALYPGARPEQVLGPPWHVAGLDQHAEQPHRRPAQR